MFIGFGSFWRVRKNGWLRMGELLSITSLNFRLFQGGSPEKLGFGSGRGCSGVGVGGCFTWDKWAMNGDEWQCMMITPPKTNMEPQNWWFVDVSPLSRGYFQVPCLFSGV